MGYPTMGSDPWGLTQVDARSPDDTVGQTRGV